MAVLVAKTTAMFLSCQISHCPSPPKTPLPLGLYSLLCPAAFPGILESLSSPLPIQQPQGQGQGPGQQEASRVQPYSASSIRSTDWLIVPASLMGKAKHRGGKSSHPSCKWKLLIFISIYICILYVTLFFSLTSCKKRFLPPCVEGWRQNN